MKFNFAKKTENEKKVQNTNSWKVLIADDEKDVHTLTKTVLKDLRYNDRPIEFISTYSAKETCEYMQNNKDIALILLDVVMETDDAGLETVKTIRTKFNNNTTQIILRTGQPGTAPETDVVIKYGINDYKEKTELTSKKLITTIITALRTFKTVKSLEANKQGLKQIIDASENIYDYSSNKLLVEGILQQIISLLKLNNDALLIEYFDTLSIEKDHDKYKVLNSTGSFEEIKNFKALNEDIQKLINQAVENKKSIFEENKCVGYLELEQNNANIIYISSFNQLKDLEKSLVEVFFRHTSTNLKNIRLHEEMYSTQKILIEVLGQVVEKRYIDDPNHIRRVAQMSYILAKKLGLSEGDAKTLKIVSPMHDVGKIGISDAILLKPGKLTPEEFEKMKEHSTIGYDILKGTKKETLDVAALVAYEHHEKWDGTGYPTGKKEKEISIYGRITALIDVYDALANKRCYKDKWENEEIIQYFKDQRGIQFDPELVDVFLDNIDEFIDIQKKF